MGMLVVISFAGDKRFGLFEIRQMGTEVYRKGEVSIAIILNSMVWYYYA
jgi:hypothetical protein